MKIKTSKLERNKLSLMPVLSTVILSFLIE
jgi:hypothetical protein